MNNHSQVKWGIVLSYFTLIVQNLSSLLITPIILRRIGQSEYGLYSLVSSTIAYMLVFDFGLGSAYIRFYSKIRNDHQKTKDLNGLFQLIFSVIAILILTVGLFIFSNTSLVFGNKLSIGELAIAKNLVLILTLNLFFTFLVSPINLFITANEKFIFLRFTTIFHSILSSVLSLFLILANQGSISLAIGLLISTLIFKSVSVYFALVKLRMPFGKFKIELSFLSELITFSSFIFIGLLIEQLNFNVDKYILGRIYGTTLVAIYGIASMLNTYYMTFSNSIYVNYIPRINQYVNAGEDAKLSDLFLSIGRIQFMILGLIATGFIFFGSEFLRMWAGDSYTSAYYIVLILMIPLTIPMIQNIGIAIQQAKNLHKFRTIVYLVIAIANVLISIPLSLKFGAIGAATGTAISILIGDGLLMNWYYLKVMKLNIIEFWISIIILSKALIIPVFFGIIIVKNIGYLNVYSFFALITFYSVIYIISAWKFGFNKEEKVLISSLIRISNP